MATAKRPWELYEVLPRDNHEIFSALTDKEREALLGSSLPEYRDDGQPAPKDAPPERVVDGKYVRPLRDYRILFAAQNLHRTLLADQIDATERDLKLVQEALEQAQQQEAAAKQDVATAKEDLKESTRQRDSVGAYLQKLQQALNVAKTDIEQFLKNNQKMAEQMAKLQLEAVRRIDERTRAMAQSGAGGT
jgi:septal ring factor EnvC (AmiA/AmiB activator)